MHATRAYPVHRCRYPINCWTQEALLFAEKNRKLKTEQCRMGENCQRPAFDPRSYDPKQFDRGCGPCTFCHGEMDVLHHSVKEYLSKLPQAKRDIGPSDGARKATQRAIIKQANEAVAKGSQLKEQIDEANYHMRIALRAFEQAQESLRSFNRQMSLLDQYHETSLEASSSHEGSSSLEESTDSVDLAPADSINNQPSRLTSPRPHGSSWADEVEEAEAQERADAQVEHQAQADGMFDDAGIAQ